MLSHAGLPPPISIRVQPGLHTPSCHRLDSAEPPEDDETSQMMINHIQLMDSRFNGSRIKARSTTVTENTT